MEFAIIAIILVAAVAGLVLLRGKEPQAEEENLVKKAKLPDTVEEKFANPIQADRRKHSTMDAPMIRSRFEKMKVHDGLEAHAKKKLERRECPTTFAKPAPPRDTASRR